MSTVRVYGGKSGGTSSAGSPLLAGLLAGSVLIIAWVVLARVTHNDVGLASWGVGGLLGIVVAKSARPPTRATGALAAILTVGTLLAAKMAVVVFALQPALRDELLQSQDAISTLYFFEMSKNHSFSPELQHTLDTRPDLLRDTSFMGAGYELKSQMISEASNRADASTPAERERLIRQHVDNTVLEKIGFWVLLLTSFGPLDLLWIGLGVTTAWKVGQGVL